MKKLIFAAMMILFATAAHAQKDVTKFLGIPVDGTKAEMIQKLKAKGFKSSYFDPEVLEGEFNGEDVEIHIVTNNNKVYRIMVSDKMRRDEGQIIIRFNTLCSQFEKNPKYTRILDVQTIPDTENIHNGIKVRNVKYQAAYYPKTVMDSTMRANALLELMQIYDDTVTNYTVERVATLMGEEFIQKLLAINSKKIVWFTIHEYSYGKYYISMYYDNEYNRANGEDL